MKLAIVGPTHPYRGGLSHFTTLLVRRLRLRHAVRFYSYARQYPRLLFPGSTAEDPSAEPLAEPCEYSIDSLNPLTWHKTARMIVSERPDALLLQWWTPFWLPLHTALASAATRARIPVVYLVHQLVEPDSSPLEWYAARAGLRAADGIVAMNAPEYATLLRSLPATPVRLGHLPPFDSFPDTGMRREDARAALGLPADVPLLLLFGFIRRYKGLPVLLEALARLADPPHLLVAGHIWEAEDEYRAQIARLGLTGRVHLHNAYIANEAIEPYFAAADAVVLPYLSGSQSAVAMVALAYGLPIITSDAGGLADAVIDGRTGFVVPAGQPEPLAGAIRRLLAGELGEDAAAAIAHQRQRLSWDALTTTIEELTYELDAIIQPR